MDDRGLSFTVSTANGQTRFRQGERITLLLRFASNRPATYRLDGATYDRSGRLSIDRYVARPADGVSDPDADYFEFPAGTSGGLRQMPVLTSVPVDVAVDLGAHLRFDRPGRYTLVVETDRVASESGRVEARSSPVELEVVPAEPEWAAQVVTGALQTLDRADATDEQKRDAALALRHLGTEAAGIAMVRLLSRGEPGWFGVPYILTRGLVASPSRSAVVRALAEAAEDPAVPVSLALLETLATLQDLQGRDERLSPLSDSADDAAREANRAQEDRLRARRSALEDTLATTLAGAASRKTPAALSTTLHTLLEFGWSRPTDPTWLPPIVARVPELLAGSDAEGQSRLLSDRWHRVASPALVPTLAALVEGATTGESLRGLALRRLYALDPQTGARAVVREIRRVPLRLGGGGGLALRILPARPIPELAENLEAGLSRRDHELDVRAALVSRYGPSTPGLRRQCVEVLAAPEGNVGHQATGAAIACLLRVDRRAGALALRNQVATESSRRRAVWVLRHVADDLWTIEVESAVIALLADERAEVATPAAELLRRHGSRAVEAPLRRRLEAWRARWRQRAAELQRHVARDNPHQDEAQLESALGDALARASGFFLDGAATAALRNGCVSSQGCQQLHSLEASARRPLGVTVFLSHDGTANAHVAQYMLDSLDALRSKLSQLPRGVELRVTVTGPRGMESRAAAIRSELEAFARGRGLVVRPSQ